jgi:DNA modification methylase
MVANRLGRRGIGIELSPDYCEMSRKRIMADPQAMNLKMQLVETEASA